MGEAKAAFAERTIRSLKKVLYRYPEDDGYKYFHKLSQFVTCLHSRINCSKDRIPKMSRVPTFCPFCTASHGDNIKNPSLKWETKFASPSLTSFSGRAISYSSRRKLLKLVQFFPQNLQHTIEMRNNMRLSVVNFIAIN